MLGTGAALLGLKVGGAAIEGAVDAKVDTEFGKLTQPFLSEANIALSGAVSVLENAKPALARFLNIVQNLQQVGVNEINGFLADLERVPFIDTTGPQKFIQAVNMALDTDENDLLALLDVIDNAIAKSIAGMDQQIHQDEQNAKMEIHEFVAHEVHSADLLAPNS